MNYSPPFFHPKAFNVQITYGNAFARACAQYLLFRAEMSSPVEFESDLSPKLVSEE